MYFLRKSRIRIFLEKGGILVLTSVNLGKNWLFFMSIVLPWKGGFIWADKSVFYHKKGFILDWKSVLYRKKGVVLSWKVTVLPQKGGHFQNGEHGWVPLLKYLHPGDPGGHLANIWIHHLKQKHGLGWPMISVWPMPLWEK